MTILTIVGKERDNMVIKARFLHDKSEEVMVKQREELHNVKSESTC